MRIFTLLFIAVPILEMWLLIKVGSLIGALPTIGLVFLTAMLGLALLRQQGIQTLFRAQQRMQHGELPASEMVEGIFLAVGGALLLTPGFFTDAVGFCCLLPGVRQVILGWALKNAVFGKVNVRSDGPHRAGESHTTIDGDYKRED
ncbi:FxsA family protein [Teredinibacter turnerae]|uniref:FxsA cytoplasmic membrane family protein n=1 Tax=Teredinibacter turnerae (strain ATCC 39867 / T7901) TaxID=377629 RepID=C5BP10_TERTT|nr:FxsA family protein [Teredinibacter turnerae]ACR14604.1 FxsA cytoplasmic membrane family protein [Teredinibacter turnerae T7901]